jgi:hypothetical protein
MKYFITFLSVVCFLLSSAQQIKVEDLETLLFSSAANANKILQLAKFKLADKESGKDYNNYYYTSYEKKDSNLVIIRSVSFMDVYSGNDTSRLLLYRTYNKNDQEEMKKQLLVNGYELTKRSANDFYYKKGNYSVLNRITEKQSAENKPVIAYEFEMGR